MKLADSHTGGKSPTLIERIRAKADAEYLEWLEAETPDAADIGRIEGMCAALGILCGTTEDLQWDSVVARQQDRERIAAKQEMEMEQEQQENGQGND
jgi:hypothetical protein